MGLIFSFITKKIEQKIILREKSKKKKFPILLINVFPFMNRLVKQSEPMKPVKFNKSHTSFYVSPIGAQFLFLLQYFYIHSARKH